MRTMRLYGTGSATASAVAYVTIPTAGTIKGVQAAVALDSSTDNGMLGLELSKIPTTQLATNGSQDPFLELRAYSNFVTSGLSTPFLNSFFPLNVSVRQGELIYLHALIAGVFTYYASFILHYE